MMGKTATSPAAVLRFVSCALLAWASVYAVLLALLTVPPLQRHAIYLRSLTQTWGQDLNVPEQWGFLHNQVTPFVLGTPDGEALDAWHVLPLGPYRRHQDDPTIPWHHSEQLFWHAVNASLPAGITFEELGGRRGLVCHARGNPEASSGSTSPCTACTTGSWDTQSSAWLW